MHVIMNALKNLYVVTRTRTFQEAERVKCNLCYTKAASYVHILFRDAAYIYMFYIFDLTQITHEHAQNTIIFYKFVTKNKINIVYCLVKQ